MAKAYHCRTAFFEFTLLKEFGADVDSSLAAGTVFAGVSNWIFPKIQPQLFSRIERHKDGTNVLQAVQQGMKWFSGSADIFRVPRLFFVRRLWLKLRRNPEFWWPMTSVSLPIRWR
jgi:hypothetical protein